jgi:acetyl esterase/lipase
LIHSECPPTLVFHGKHDCGVPIEGARTFCKKLREARVPVALVEFPQTDHGFDIQMMFLGLESVSQYSPAAESALYHVDRFLALMAYAGERDSGLRL